MINRAVSIHDVLLGAVMTKPANIPTSHDAFCISFLCGFCRMDNDIFDRGASCKYATTQGIVFEHSCFNQLLRRVTLRLSRVERFSNCFSSLRGTWRVILPWLAPQVVIGIHKQCTWLYLLPLINNDLFAIAFAIGFGTRVRCNQQ